MSSYNIINSDHPLYIRACTREGKNWGRSFVAERRAKRPRNHPLIQEYFLSLLDSNKKYDTWVDWFAANYGPFEKAISLGSGSGMLEEQMIDLGIFRNIELVDLSENAVKLFKDRISAKNLDIEINPRISDLNFIDLPENHYDLIIANTSLHHITNLERLFEQVRNALQPGGIFLVHDFIGPSKWQWTDEAMSEVNGFVNKHKDNYSKVFLSNIVKPDPEKIKSFSPFESVRSGEILELIHSGFNVVQEVQTDRFLHIFLNYSLEIDEWDSEDVKEVLNEAVKVEDSVINKSSTPPCTVLGLYSTSDRSIAAPEPWTEEQISTNIGIGKVSAKTAILDIIDKTPFSKSLIAAWMKIKRKFGLY